MGTILYRSSAVAVLGALLVVGLPRASLQDAQVTIGDEATGGPRSGAAVRAATHGTDDPLRDRANAARAAVEQRLTRLRRDGPKSMDRPREAEEFFLMQRVTPGERYPIERLQATLAELRERETLVRAQRGDPPGGVKGWLGLGPGNIGGRTRAIVIDPTNPDIMYAAGVTGGIWKSTDAGASWAVADDSMLNMAVSSLAMDPTNPNVLYAGTGEGFFGSGVRQGLGIFKSSDAGATWSLLNGTVNGAPTGSFYYVNKIVISPNDHDRIYAATRFGVWRSLDAGQSWSVVLRNPVYLAGAPASDGCTVGCTDLVVRQDTNPDVLFAAFGSFQQDALLRSDDGGDTWLKYTTGANQGRMTIALAPSNNDIMYILMADNGSGGAVGQLVSVFRSDDGGATFNSTVDFGHPFGPWLLNNLVLTTGCLPDRTTYAQGWYDNIIAVDPVDPDIVWVGGVDLFRSDDGGATFGLTEYWFYYTLDPLPPDYAHPDEHLIVFHPDYDGVSNQTMYVGNDGGIFVTQNARAATTQEECPLCPDPLDPNCDFGPGPEIVWDNLNNNYGVTQFYHGDSARDADVFVGGAQDNGTNRVQAADAPNAWKLVFGGDGGYVAIHPQDSQTMYVEYHEFPSIQKSIDGGDTFVQATNGIIDNDGIFITPLAMDQLRPNILWTGGRRPWRTRDDAVSWQTAGPDFGGADRISAIAVSESSSRFVYLGFTNGYVARTNHGLADNPDWTVFGAGNGLPVGAYVSSVTVDPVDPDVAYATYSSFGVPHVYRTVNGGQTWTSIDGTGANLIPDIPVHWLAVRPCDTQQLYVGTELGMFASDDGGANWLPVNEGAAYTIVESLDFQDNNTLVAFTHGRGAFRARLIPCASCPGDADGDGDCDLTDLAVLLADFGLSGVGWEGDLNGDGVADLTDLAIVLAHFDEECG